jgi:hypothetical protein
MPEVVCCVRATLTELASENSFELGVFQYVIVCGLFRSFTVRGLPHLINPSAMGLEESPLSR